jgi:integrase
MKKVAEDRGWNIYRLKSGPSAGRRVLQYRVRPGEWKETRIPREYHTDRQAERWALAWLAEYRKTAGARPVLPDPGEDAPTIRSLADTWLDLVDSNPKLSPGMRKQHAYVMSAHVLSYPDVADVPLAHLGPSVLRAWIRKVRDTGRLTAQWKTGEDGKRTRTITRGGKLAPFTVRNVVNSLTAFFADMLAEEKVNLPANPMKHEAVRREVPDGVTLAGRHLILHMGRETAAHLITCPVVPEWRHVRYLLAFTSGMGEGELSALTFDDAPLDVDIPVAKVTKSLAQKGPDGWATIGPTKTPNRVRTLPLHHLAVRALRAWRATGWAQWVGRAPVSTDIIFPNDKGEPWRPPMAQMLRADLRAAGLPDTMEGHNLTAHATRRSFATWLSEAGVDEASRDRLMGHAAASVAEKHYTATILAKLRDAVECIKLDLAMGQVIALPLRMVASGETASTLPSEAPQTDSLTVVHTVALGKLATGAAESSTVADTPGAVGRLDRQSPKLMPSARAVCTMSPSGEMVRSLPMALVMGTATVSGGWLATIMPNFSSAMSCTARAPKRVQSSRSKVVGPPPRCRWPRTTTRVSLPVRFSSSWATT